MCENRQSEAVSYLNRPIPRWHLFYVISIALILIIVVICIVPGRINDDAYQNFSFAATVVSIVLAVVSIVYSLQTEHSSAGQLGTIKDVELRISKELQKFSDIDAKISKALEPFSNDISELKESQSAIQSSQINAVERMDKLMNIQIFSTSSNHPLGESFSGPAILSLILYTALLSKKTQKDMPFHIFCNYTDRKYTSFCDGIIEGMAIMSDKIKIEKGSKPGRKRISCFDESYYGNKESLKERSLALQIHDIEKFICDIEGYFELENRGSSDSEDLNKVEANCL